MARKTKKENDEIVETYYGIDPKTFEVANVTKTRGGTLTRWFSDGRTFRHPIAPGRDARKEVVIVFHLREIYSVPISLDGTDSTNARIEALKLKAAEMKKKAEDESKK